LDGQEGTQLGPGDVVRVTRSPRSIHLVKVSGRSFYDNLRAKLRWGGLAFEGGVETPTVSGTSGGTSEGTPG
jgi:hypothetical protein